MANKKFEIVGGNLEISDDIIYDNGFSIGISYTKSQFNMMEDKYKGGVISLEQAKELADHIYEKLSKTDKYKGEIRKYKIESLNKE